MKLVKSMTVYSAFGWIFTLAVCMACGTVLSFSGEAWLLYQEREEAVDDSVLQEIVAVIVLRWFVMNLRQLVRMVESSGFLRKPDRFSY